MASQQQRYQPGAITVTAFEDLLKTRAGWLEVEDGYIVFTNNTGIREYLVQYYNAFYWYPEDQFNKFYRNKQFFVDQEGHALKGEKNEMKLKHTDGYCSVCGAPNASYVANPYYDDVYGETRMEWLCDSCCGDIAGDI